MEQKTKNRLNWGNLAYIFCFFFILSLFFPIRFVFPTKNAFILGVFSDFTAYSLYLSDILLFITWGFTLLSRGGILPRGKILYYVVKPQYIFLIWLILAILLRFKPISGLNIYYLTKFFELIVAYGTFKLLFQETSFKVRALQIFVALSSIQALIALGQFWKNGPLGMGLNKLGEQLIYPIEKGVAKLALDDTLQVRGYGTFPHPNLLSAFLLVSIFLLVHLLKNANKTWQKVLFSLCLTLNIFGLTATFSRAAYLALGIGLLIYFGFLSYKKLLSSRGVQAIIIILISLIACFSIFKPYLLTRTNISGESTVERMIYTKAGLEMIKNHPLVGVGIGESVLHMQQFSPTHLWSWQVQPIHNYFLLAAAEIGIPGVLILFWIFLSHLKAISYLPRRQAGNLKADFSSYYLLLTTLLLCFLVLMFFDHYFYTLQQTQMLLWITLGLIAAETQTPSFLMRG